MEVVGVVIDGSLLAVLGCIWVLVLWVIARWA
jgi:hypothetical protein